MVGDLAQRNGSGFWCQMEPWETEHLQFGEKFTTAANPKEGRGFNCEFTNNEAEAETSEVRFH